MVTARRQAPGTSIYFRPAISAGVWCNRANAGASGAGEHAHHFQSAREENAASLKGILAAEITGAKRDLVVINAASGFVVAGLARDLNDGIALAREQIDSGRALEKLRALQNYQPKVSA